MLEGEYTTWTLLWTQDYGAAADLVGITCDNYGTVYVADRTANTSYVITRAGVSTTFNNYRFLNWIDTTMSTTWSAIPRPYSATAKYMLAWKTNIPRAISVWRNGTRISEIFWQTVTPDALWICGIMISANGRYIAVIFRSIATGNKKYVQLYEGQ